MLATDIYKILTAAQTVPVTVNVDTLFGLMRRHSDPRTHNEDRDKLFSQIAEFLLNVKLSLATLENMTRAQLNTLSQYCEAVAFATSTERLEDPNYLAYNTHNTLCAIVLK